MEPKNYNFAITLIKKSVILKKFFANVLIKSTRKGCWALNKLFPKKKNSEPERT